MLNSSFANDITFVKVCVKLNFECADGKLNLNKILKQKLRLKEVIPYYNIDSESKGWEMFDPSCFKESFIKFKYYSVDEMSEKEDDDFLLYHDLEPWRNTFVNLVVEEGLEEKSQPGVIEENIYRKTVTVKELDDMNTYYDITANVFKILNNYYKSLKYLKLKSPSDVLVSSEETVNRVNFQNNVSEASSTYYQWTKAKYKMNNTDLNIQISSRQLKFKANLLILAGQYQSALECLNDCIIQFYKNGDFLWLANALEMLIFVILNIAAISDSVNEGIELVVPSSVDYLIDYDKHCICRDKITKRSHLPKRSVEKISNGQKTPRESTDAPSLKSVTSDNVDGKTVGAPKKHVIFLQALPLLICDIYEKLVHYYEYTANEASNFVTTITLNNTVINYLHVLHLSIITSDFNEWLEKLTDIKVFDFEPHYLQPIMTDLQFQLKKFEKINLVKNLPIFHSFKWIQLQTSLSKTLDNERNLIFLIYSWISANINGCDFTKLFIFNESVIDFLFHFVLKKLDNKIITRKLVILLISISQSSAMINQVCEIGVKNYEIFSALEQRTLFEGLKGWPRDNKSLLVTYEAVQRNSGNNVLPDAELAEKVQSEQKVDLDEVFNPYRDKDYSRAEKLPVVEHIYIKNETIILNLVFKNYYNIDLLVTNIKLCTEQKQFLAVVDFTPARLQFLKTTIVTVKVKCIKEFAEGFIEYESFIVNIAEFQNDDIRMYELNKRSVKMFKVLPEQPLLSNRSPLESTFNCDTVNKCELLIQRENDIDIEIFDIKAQFDDAIMNPLEFFGKMKINRAESYLYDYMVTQLQQSINIKHIFDKKNLCLNIEADFKKFKAAPASKINIIVKYGLTRDNIKYISTLNVPWNIMYNEKLIVTNLEILPLNTIPSEQISLGELSDYNEAGKRESWLHFIEKDQDFKWLLLLNVRNISSKEITLNYRYEDKFQSENYLFSPERNQRIIIPIESSLFDNNLSNEKGTAYNILMNFNNLIHINYTENKELGEYEMNLLANVKLEDCFNSQKLVNRQDISIYLSQHENVLTKGQIATIVLKPGLNLSKNKSQNILVSLMVIDTITGKDVLQDSFNTVLINGMRTFNIDGNQKSVTVDCIFLLPGNYEINCLCEIGDDPSRVVKFFSTRPFTVRVI